ncbi:YheC/YheD family protein [Paenibacillus cremeus]|uniref:YheC/YheD family protein n=1 Tax=Paenibacillus cremeus TaxID=2163881 RepID=UPI0016461DF0|nr:YheC/YheD family protein [Paenibacillus cremeus]
MGKYPNTKLGNTKHLISNVALRKHYPETHMATAKQVQRMLERYRMVYVKPNVGTGGHGVMKAERLTRSGKMKYRFKLGTMERQFTTYPAFYAALRHAFRGRSYVVQRGIRMLTYRKRPFDIRIMVQLNRSGRWTHTGTIGRLAHPKRIVTNYHSGGTPLPLERLMRPYLRGARMTRFARRIAALGVRTALHMQQGYPRLKEAGVDVGVDRKLRPWIFEVNFRPDPFIFLKLGKPAVFRRIIDLTRYHGRFRKK